MIKVEGLSKRYARTLAVDDISFEVEKGQIVGFLGPNGAGKTTTMRVLTCFLPPTSGTAKVAGFDVLEQALEVKRHIGYLPETPPLYPDMEVQDYLTFVGRLKGLSSSDLAKRVLDVCERCAILDVKNKLIGKLSKGYRQRVGLAQAILHNPDVLILDEPTSGLDPKQIIETRELIRSLAGDQNDFSFLPGYRSSFGPYLLSRYNWSLNPHLDGALHADWREKRGLGIGPDLFYHLGEFGSGAVKYYYTHDEQPGIDPFSSNAIPSYRQRLYFSYDANLRTNLDVKAQVAYQTDPFIVRDFFESEYRKDTQPNTFADVNQQWRNWSLDVLALMKVNGCIRMKPAASAQFCCHEFLGRRAA